MAIAATAATAKFKIASLSCPKSPGDDSIQPRGQFLRLQDVVDDDLDGPRLQDVGKGFSQHRDERDRQPFQWERNRLAAFSFPENENFLELSLIVSGWLLGPNPVVL